MSNPGPRLTRWSKHHPLVHQLLDQTEQFPEHEICKKAGVGSSYLTNLRKGQVTNPSLMSLFYIAEVVGYEIKLVKKGTSDG